MITAGQTLQNHVAIYSCDVKIIYLKLKDKTNMKICAFYIRY